MHLFKIEWIKKIQHMLVNFGTYIIIMNKKLDLRIFNYILEYQFLDDRVLSFVRKKIFL